MAKKGSSRAARQTDFHAVWPEIAKVSAGLHGGVFEAFEVLGRTLAEQTTTDRHADMCMAVVFELLPYDAQEKCSQIHELKTARRSCRS